LRPTASLAVTILNRPAVPGPVQVEFVEIKSVIAAHSRAVLSNETIDIESSDEATLARWFADKFSFPVMIPRLSNLSKPGFRLRGGRIDYLQDRPAPTLALTSRGHPISLYVIPSKDTDAVAVRGNRNGYNVIGWADSDFAYFAASDIKRDELDALQDECSEAGTPQGRSLLPGKQLS
jgi:anti-sigma factor RsiW